PAYSRRDGNRAGDADDQASWVRRRPEVHGHAGRAAGQGQHRIRRRHHLGHGVTGNGRLAPGAVTGIGARISEGLALGTVQLGMRYGILGYTPPPEHRVAQLLQVAWAEGVRYYDT